MQCGMRYRRVLAVGLLLLCAAARVDASDVIASKDVRIVGVSLAVSPASQTVHAAGAWLDSITRWWYLRLRVEGHSR